MIPVTVTKTLAAASATAVCASQALAAAGNLLINGSAAANGVAVLDTQRQVLITSAGNDSGINFTVYGTTDSGVPIQETLAGGNIAAVATSLDFLTVTRVAASGAVATTVEVGTNGVGSTQWRVPNYHVTPFTMQFLTEVIGTVSYSIEYTNDDVVTPKTPTPIPNVGEILATQTTGISETVQYPFRAWRITVNSGTGTVSAQAVQAGIVNY